MTTTTKIFLLLSKTRLLLFNYILGHLDKASVQVQGAVTLTYNMKRTELYKPIDQRRKRLEKRGYEPDEADETAWDDRRFLLKRYIKNNTEGLTEAIFPKEEEEEDEKEEPNPYLRRIPWKP